jgi:hypothetical protein
MDQPSTAQAADRPRTESTSPPQDVPGQTAPTPDLATTTPAQLDPPPRQETAATIATDAARQIRGLRFALGCAVALALAVILTAIGIQSGRILDREGHGWSFRLLFGPDVASGINMQGWRVVSEPGQLTRPEWYANLLIAFNVIDFAFIAVYFFLLRAVIRTLARGRWLTWCRGLLWGLVGVDVAENLLSLPGWPDVPAVVIVAATALKWVALLAIVVLLVLSAVTSPKNRSERGLAARIKRTYKAVMHQRFSFVPVVALFVLSVPSGAAILEQLPDVLRRWISDGGRGAAHAFLAMLSTVGLAVFLIIAGRYRSGYAFRHPPPPRPLVKDKEDPLHLRIWLVGPSAALVAAIVVLLSGRGGDVEIVRLVIFVLVPLLVIVISSWLLHVRWEKHPTEYRFDRPPTFDERELTAVRLAGNIAGIGALTVGGLSLIRAYVPLVIVPTSATFAKPWLVWMFLAIGAGTVVVPWLVGIRVVRATAKRRTPKPDEGKPVGLRTYRRPDRPVGSWVLLGCAVGIFVSLGLFPSFAAAIGVAATATLALGSIAGMLSAVALIIQDRPTAEVFRWVGLRRTPLVTMLALTLVLVSIFGGQSSIHEVDRGATSTSADDTRLTMADSFDAWMRSPEPCLTAAGGRPVRPMLLIAAEGGGIRAAYWTVRGLQAIADTTCGERSALFSAGASGGSVGLTVARFSGTPDSPNSAGAVEAVKQMAAPGILARAADGTFVRDLVYGASGVPVQRYGESDPFSWRDRGRLIEDGWAGASGDGGLDWGDRDFLTPNEELSPSTGQLILNSSDVKHTCRVWVSQVSPGLPVTESGASFDPERSCDKTPGPGARTIDLFTAYGPFVPGSDPESCLGRIRSSTAALLTARFPYVTPSAVIGPCPQVETEDGKAPPYWPRTQLVDGGYIENSGLATITDLSDDWLSLVRDHNADVLDTEGSTEPLVVPIVVFLTNGDRAVVQPALDSSPTSELAVPLLTYLRGGTSLTGNDALLERTRAAVEIGGFCPVTELACADLQRHFPSRVVVVDRVTQPEIGAPLGWVLSEASITSMDVAMTQSQLSTHCDANRPRVGGADAPVQADRETQPSCRTGYATLGDLVRYYTTTS